MKNIRIILSYILALGLYTEVTCVIPCSIIADSHLEHI